MKNLEKELLRINNNTKINQQKLDAIANKFIDCGINTIEEYNLNEEYCINPQDCIKTLFQKTTAQMMPNNFIQIRLEKSPCKDDDLTIAEYIGFRRKFLIYPKFFEQEYSLPQAYSVISHEITHALQHACKSAIPADVCSTIQEYLPEFDAVVPYDKSILETEANKIEEIVLNSMYRKFGKSK